MVLIVLASVMIPAATTAVWATRTVLDNDRFTATVTSVVSDPAVVSAASTYVTNQAFEAVSGSNVINQLPPILRPVLGIIGGALRSRVEGQVNDVLSSGAGQALLVGAVQRAHSAAMRLLEGDGLFSSDALSVDNGTVTLDLRPIIRQVLVRLQSDGVIPASVTIPAEGDPPGKLGQALGAVLPDNFGQIVVYQTDSVAHNNVLDRAQHALVLAKRAVVLIVLLALVLAVAAVLVAADRRRAIFRLGVGVTIGALLLIVVARRVAATVPKATTTANAQAVSSALADSLRSSLVRVLLIAAIIAMAIALVALLGNRLVGWAGGHADMARLIAAALGVVVLLVLGMGWGSIILAVVVAGVGLLGVRYSLRAGTSPATGT